jgi:hypothetical protein
VSCTYRNYLHASEPSCAATQELSNILRNSKVHYHVCKGCPPVPVLIWISLVSTTQSNLSKILYSIQSVPPSPISPRSYIHSSFVLYAHLILLNLTILIMLGAPHYATFSNPLSLHLLSTLFSNTLSLRFSFNVRDQVSHPYITTGKIIVLHSLNQILIFCCFQIFGLL